jgi:hypothetical protein
MVFDASKSKLNPVRRGSVWLLRPLWPFTWKHVGYYGADNDYGDVLQLLAARGSAALLWHRYDPGIPEGTTTAEQRALERPHSRPSGLRPSPYQSVRGWG